MLVELIGKTGRWCTACGILLLCLSVSVSGAEYKLFDPLIDVCDLIRKHYVTDENTDDLVSAAINGMLHELDPYSEYIPGKELDDFEKRSSGTYEGVGLGIDIVNGYLTVISPFEDGPAYHAGVLPGDIVLEVNGESTKGWSATKAVKELTGPANTDVTIKVLHRESGEEETFTLTRQTIKMRTVRGWRRNTVDASWDYLLDDEAGIGYLRITQFNDDTLEHFEQAMRQLRGQGVKALILDLRSNPGGLMSAAIGIVDRFIDHGIIVSTRGAHSEEHIQYAQTVGTYPRFHLVVLIDQGSASASEIVAGSLQDHGRAVIVGERSWGKGSVQRIIHLYNSEAALKLTTDYYYLPKGRCVHKRRGAEEWGVTPDVTVAFDFEQRDELRELGKTLTIEPLGGVKAHDGEAEKTDKASFEETLEARREQDVEHKKTLKEELLGLDKQLDQGYKQCQGLLRVRSVLSGLAESLETGSGDDDSASEGEAIQ